MDCALAAGEWGQPTNQMVHDSGIVWSHRQKYVTRYRHISRSAVSLEDDNRTVAYRKPLTVRILGSSRLVASLFLGNNQPNRLVQQVVNNNDINEQYAGVEFVL